MFGVLASFSIRLMILSTVKTFIFYLSNADVFLWKRFIIMQMEYRWKKGEEWKKQWKFKVIRNRFLNCGNILTIFSRWFLRSDSWNPSWDLLLGVLINA